jgi:hypothetical protein
VGTATFDGTGNVNGTDNQSSSNGFNTSIISPANGGNLFVRQRNCAAGPRHDRKQFYRPHYFQLEDDFHEHRLEPGNLHHSEVTSLVGGLLTLALL